MGSPFNISGSASQVFFKNKHSAEYKALSTIADSFAHPQRALVSAFVLNAVDRELASQFFLDEVSVKNKGTASEFLADWTCLLQKVRPFVCTNVKGTLKQNIWKRDGGRCCVSRAGNGKQHDESPLLTCLLSPSFFSDGVMANNKRLSKILVAFIGDSQCQNLRSLMADDSVSDQDHSGQLMLLSAQNFEHFRNGRISLKRSVSMDESDSAGYLVASRNYIPSIQVKTFHFTTLENRAIGLALLPNAQILEIHHRCAEALAWLEVSEYMRSANTLDQKGKRYLPNPTNGTPARENHWSLRYLQGIRRACRNVWIQTPAFFRAFAYKRLVNASDILYGHTGSDRVYRLPFNLYLRVARSDWASKHQAEAESLRLVEKYTHIPAPRVVDILQYSDTSFLLMTGTPGEIIGRRICTMTDEQLHSAAQDLKNYIAELRQIPNKTGSGFQICNALGGGILDWRIGDSQRRELRFQDETQFSEYLVDDLPLDEEAWKTLSKSHSVKHDIVFTHADINLRNLLVDKDGKISGIVDWECAGWYPAYWEFTKAHFSARYNVRWTADVIDQVFLGYRDELRAEDVLTSMAPPW
ncbi:kinase-like domain-containing protein [Massariosphaeria phaeospora]|uniref:Kinase-like domain-containing protein n=1 Tax=Massariosphaeria phaeospora TaxID=100035 RepID=A0A7C8MCE5_9PLEO|nr:kinase-like domain-containing protein [Massariosphaeria phaeospora]